MTNEYLNNTLLDTPWNLQSYHVGKESLTPAVSMKDNIIDSRGGSRRDSNFNKLIISDKGLNLTSNPTVEVGRIHILAAMHASYCLNSPREHSRQRSQPAELQQNTPSTAMNDEVPLLSTLKSRAIKTTIRKCPEYNLFRSRGQILPVEVNLKIIESVVALNPDVVGILRCLSKVVKCNGYKRIVLTSTEFPWVVEELRIFNSPKCHTQVSEYWLPSPTLLLSTREHQNPLDVIQMVIRTHFQKHCHFTSHAA